MSVHSCKWVKRRAQKVCLAEILTLSKAVVNKKAFFRLLLQYCLFEWSLMLMEQQKEQLQCCSKMCTTWPKSSWAIFLRCQQTNVHTQVLRSFSAFAVDDFSFPLPDKTAPREQWHTYGRALDRQKSGLGALLSSCSLSARSEPAASDGTTAWETQGMLLFTLQDPSSDLPYGRNGLVSPSCVWFVVWGKKILLLRRAVDSISLLQKQKNQPMKGKKPHQCKNTLYANDQNNKYWS